MHFGGWTRMRMMSGSGADEAEEDVGPWRGAMDAECRVLLQLPVRSRASGWQPTLQCKGIKMEASPCGEGVDSVELILPDIYKNQANTTINSLILWTFLNKAIRIGEFIPVSLSTWHQVWPCLRITGCMHVTSY